MSIKNVDMVTIKPFEYKKNINKRESAEKQLK